LFVTISLPVVSSILTLDVHHPEWQTLQDFNFGIKFDIKIGHTWQLSGTESDFIALGAVTVE
jgi:hypothetical protein